VGSLGHSSRILVVEDDRVIADAIARRLISEGFQVDAVHDGLAAVAAVAAAGLLAYDATILDVMLPGLDGHEVCRRIQAGYPLPVLMLTAKADETDRIVGLGVGADDYLIKPFSPRELVARVRALLRRVDRAAQLAAAVVVPDPGARLELGAGLILDVGARRVELSGAEVHLTRTEFDLLHALARRPGQVVRRERLLAEVWSWPEAPTGAAASRAADSHIKALRRKLGRDRIRTVQGVGYAWEQGSCRELPSGREPELKRELGR
jgi:DNA-binding response OmpR family regulator